MHFAHYLSRLIGPIELIHAQAGPRLLQKVRWGVCSLWILKLLLDPLWRLSELPTELYNPIGILALLSDEQRLALFSRTGLTLFWSATLVTLFLSLIPRFFFLASTLVSFFITFYACLIRAYGTAYHTDISLIYATYALTAFAWVDVLYTRAPVGPEERRRWNSYPLILIVALLSLTYALVGFNRILLSGLPAFYGGAMEFWAVDAGLRAYYFDTGIGQTLPQMPVMSLMMQLGLPITTIVEILAPLCLVSPRFRWIFIPYMLAFHFMSLVMLNIFFFDNILLFLLLVDWDKAKTSD